MHRLDLGSRFGKSRLHIYLPVGTPRLPCNQEAGIGIAYRGVTTSVFSGGTVPFQGRTRLRPTGRSADHVNKRWERLSPARAEQPEELARKAKTKSCGHLRRSS